MRPTSRKDDETEEGAKNKEQEEAAVDEEEEEGDSVPTANPTAQRSTSCEEYNDSLRNNNNSNKKHRFQFIIIRIDSKRMVLVYDKNR